MRNKERKISPFIEAEVILLFSKAQTGTTSCFFYQSVLSQIFIRFSSQPKGLSAFGTPRLSMFLIIV